jgi:hypothetical protein
MIVHPRDRNASTYCSHCSTARAASTGTRTKCVNSPRTRSGEGRRTSSRDTDRTYRDRSAQRSREPPRRCSHVERTRRQSRASRGRCGKVVRPPVNAECHEPVQRARVRYPGPVQDGGEGPRYRAPRRLAPRLSLSTKPPASPAAGWSAPSRPGGDSPERYLATQADLDYGLPASPHGSRFT